jgi:AhpD family alkylhydroperoxidase
MTMLEVFDPAMCCSTGVCGPAPDPVLPAFAADLDWVADQGVAVRRFNLSQEPGEFVQRPAVHQLLTRDGDDALPIVMLGDTVLSSGRYPSRDELAGWAGVADTPPVSVWSDAVAELVALGASVGANCEPCFKVHYDKARKLGVAHDDLVATVRLAQQVKDTPAKAMVDLAAKLLAVETSAFGSTGITVDPVEADAGEACCGGAAEPVLLSRGPATAEADSGRCGGSAEAVAQTDQRAAAGSSSGCCG